jgi:hypothetical protein
MRSVGSCRPPGLAAGVRQKVTLVDSRRRSTQTIAHQVRMVKGLSERRPLA